MKIVNSECCVMCILSYFKKIKSTGCMMSSVGQKQSPHPHEVDPH